MKKVVFGFFLTCLLFDLNGQTMISLPGVYSQMFHNYPRTSDEISFSLPYPFKDYPNTRLDPVNTHQYLVNLPWASDSLLSVCIGYAMNAWSFEPAWKNLLHGTEIWYGPITNKMTLDLSMTGIYFKHSADSTKIYILTTYSLSYHKKRKENTSKYVGESIKTLLERYRARK